MKTLEKEAKSCIIHWLFTVFLKQYMAKNKNIMCMHICKSSSNDCYQGPVNGKKFDTLLSQ